MGLFNILKEYLIPEPKYETFCGNCGRSVILNTRFKPGKPVICRKCNKSIKDIVYPKGEYEEFLETRYLKCKVCGKRYTGNNGDTCYSCKYESIIINPSFIITSCKNCGKEFSYINYDSKPDICYTCSREANFEYTTCKVCGVILYNNNEKSICYKCLAQEGMEISIENKLKKEIQNCKDCGREYIVYNKFNSEFCSCCELKHIKHDYKSTKDFNVIELQEVQKCRTCGIEFNPKNTKDIVCDNCQNA